MRAVGDQGFGEKAHEANLKAPGDNGRDICVCGGGAEIPAFSVSVASFAASFWR